MLKKRIMSILDAMSQLFNVTFFPRVSDTDANESISGRSYREAIPWRVRLIDFIFSPLESEHCRKSFENDYARAQEFVEENKELYNNPAFFKKKRED